MHSVDSITRVRPFVRLVTIAHTARELGTHLVRARGPCRHGQAADRRRGRHELAERGAPRAAVLRYALAGMACLVRVSRVHASSLRTEMSHTRSMLSHARCLSHALITVAHTGRGLGTHQVRVQGPCRHGQAADRSRGRHEPAGRGARRAAVVPRYALAFMSCARVLCVHELFAQTCHKLGRFHHTRAASRTP
jgi:hypothetical protein